MGSKNKPSISPHDSEERKTDGRSSIVPAGASNPVEDVQFERPEGQKKKKKKKKPKKRKKSTNQTETEETPDGPSNEQTVHQPATPVVPVSPTHSLSFINTPNQPSQILTEQCTIYAGANAIINAQAGARVHLGYGAIVIDEFGVSDPFSQSSEANPPDYQTTPASPSSSTGRLTRDNTPTPQTENQSSSPKVEIKYGLEWKDQKGVTEVPRHLPLKDLQSIRPVEAIKQAYAPEATVRVSPAKSAASDTRVTVESSYVDLMARMREDMANELEQRITNKLTKAMRYSWTHAFSSERKAFALMLRRNLEDHTISKMRAILPHSENIGFHGVIRRFQAKYVIEEFSEADYDGLSNSARRQEANNFAHLQENSLEFKVYKELLMDQLRAEGTQGEVEKYMRYYDFAVGNIGYAEK